MEAKSAPHYKFYVVHRARYNDWSFPKGHPEPNETLADAALREVKEETGMTCKIVQPLPLYRYRLSSGERVHVYFFEMKVVESGATTDDEVDQGLWQTHEEVRTLLSYPSLVEYLHIVFPQV